jgi:hypothetical protein
MAKSGPHLQIALRGGQWISIGAVSSGLSCACHCPACGAALIAKKGRKQIHHFAHAHGTICSGSLETVLHRYAKAVLIEAKAVLVPAIAIFRGPVIRPPQWIKAKTAYAEKTLDKLRLDVLLTSANFRLAVEIMVSHPVDEYKKKRLIKLGIPAIEIDLKSIYHELSANKLAGDLDALKQAILRHPTHRKWLFSPLQHRWEYRLAKEAHPRRVYHSKQGEYHHYHVYRCPRQLRFVRGGYRDGQSYARVFQDCLHCESCREIIYDKKWVAFRETPQLPLKILCNG